MVQNFIRRSLFLVSLMTCLASLYASDMVFEIDNKLMMGDQYIRFCALDNYSFKLSSNDVNEENVGKCIEENDKLLDALVNCGINLVKLDNLHTFVKGALKPEDIVYNNFVASCSKKNLKICAEVLLPNMYGVSTNDVSSLVDPFTEKRWIKSVAEYEGDDLMLAAVWDPRMEVALQTRVRQWGESFNESIGKSRADNDVFAYWSFSSDWPQKMFENEWVNLPEFFREELLSEWNRFLNREFDSDEDRLEAIAFVLPNEKETLPVDREYKFITTESLLVDCNQMTYVDVSKEIDNLDLIEKRLRLQKKFLQKLFESHIKRVKESFCTSGTVSRRTPIFVDVGGAFELSEGISDIYVEGVNSTSSRSGVELSRCDVSDREKLLDYLRKDDGDSSIVELNVGAKKISIIDLSILTGAMFDSVKNDVIIDFLAEDKREDLLVNDEGWSLWNVILDSNVAKSNANLVVELNTHNPTNQLNKIETLPQNSSLASIDTVKPHKSIESIGLSLLSRNLQEFNKKIVSSASLYVDVYQIKRTRSLSKDLNKHQIVLKVNCPEKTSYVLYDDNGAVVLKGQTKTNSIVINLPTICKRYKLEIKR